MDSPTSMTSNKILFWGVAATTGIAVAAALYHATKSTYESMVPLKVREPHLTVFDEHCKMAAGQSVGAPPGPCEAHATDSSHNTLHVTVSVPTRDNQWLDGKRSDPVLTEQEK